MSVNAIAQPPASTNIARAKERLADRSTPFITDCWYVAGWGKDFTRDLCERTLLGRSLVLYRRTDGQPVALQNRCPHRSFPLASGKLEGDVLRCGYHGIAFNANGSCAEIPTQNVVPRNVCVPSYPLAERGPFVWIWMGDRAAADESKIPDTSWLTSAEWSYATNYLALKGSYVYLHENLLDLSHFTYLHPTTLGTPEYAQTPFDVDVQHDKVRITRRVPECDVPPIYARTGIKGKMSRHTTSEFVSPAVHHASALLADLDASPRDRKDFTIYITHFLTPESQGQTHYWFAFARDFAINDQEASDYMGAGALTAFNEDKLALEAISRIYALEPEAASAEFHIKSDQAGVAMRRILHRRAEGK